MLICCCWIECLLEDMSISSFPSLSMQRSEMIDSIHHSIHVKLLLALLVTLVIDSKKCCVS